jgi:hypothetical protein
MLFGKTPSRCYYCLENYIVEKPKIHYVLASGQGIVDRSTKMVVKKEMRENMYVYVTDHNSQSRCAMLYAVESNHEIADFPRRYKLNLDP